MVGLAGTAPARGQRGAQASGWLNIVVVVVGLAIVAGGWWLSREQELVIFVVSMDTTRPDHLSAYGYERETTPTLARLAAEGTRFTNARSTTSWTLPAHMSLFTGLPPDLHDVDIDFKVLDEGRATMGEIFKDAGFFTAGFYTAPYVHPRFGFDRGFDFYEQCTREPMAYDMPAEQVSEEAALREQISHQEVTSHIALRNAAAVFERQAAQKFFFMHLFDPHYDFRAPDDRAAMFQDADYVGPIVNQLPIMGSPHIHADMPQDDLDALLGLYDAELRWTDDNLAGVIERIEEEGLVGRALVVVVSDHGEEFFENGKFGHRGGLRDEVLRVPMIFWGPGLVPEGLEIDDEVALYDVLPTLMDYAGIPERDDLYGRSLRPLMEGKPLEPRPTVASLTFLHADRESEHYTRHDSMVYQGLKYTRAVERPWSAAAAADLTRPATPEQKQRAVIEVYDLEADPGETRNLWTEAPDDPRNTRMAEIFRAEKERIVGLARAQRRLGAYNDGRMSTAEDFIKHLEAVGYAQGTDSDDVGPAPAAGPGDPADG